MKSFAFLLLLLLPLSVWGQTQTLVNLPGAEGDFNTYINSIYTLAISIAALLAVIKIVIAGVKWMTTDVVSSKGDAKKDIQGALFGLLVIIGAVIILTVINPNLLEVNLTMREMQTPDPSEWGGGSGGSLGDDDLQNTILEYCRENNDCSTERCDQLDFSQQQLGIISDIGNVLQLDYLANRASCSIWCDLRNGEIIGGGPASGICLYPRSEGTEEAIIENLIEDSPQCADGCKVQNCSFWRWDLSCNQWCENRGGINVNLSFINGAAQCILPLGAPEFTYTETELDQAITAIIEPNQLDPEATEVFAGDYPDDNILFAVSDMDLTVEEQEQVRSICRAMVLRSGNPYVETPGEEERSSIVYRAGSITLCKTPNS